MERDCQQWTYKLDGSSKGVWSDFAEKVGAKNRCWLVWYWRKSGKKRSPWIMCHASLASDWHWDFQPGMPKRHGMRHWLLEGLESEQAPWAWNIKLGNTLKEMDFQQCMQEKVVYKAVTNGEFIIVAIYMDDLFVTRTSLDCINEFKKRMASQFEMSDLRNITSLGIEYKRGNDMRLVGYSNHNVDIDDGHVFYLAEFMVAIIAACQAIWLREVLAKVMENEQVIIEHVSGENQRAKPLTKALACIRFKDMRSLLGVQELPSSNQKFKG
ncbi:uncharacterized mitochondrial protein-like protein [Tanacetum coccineum]